MSEANIYIDSQAPWSLKNTDLNRMNDVLYLICAIIIKSTIMLLPIIPESALKVLQIFNIDKDNINFLNLENIVNEEITVTNPQPIFPRIER